MFNDYHMHRAFSQRRYQTRCLSQTYEGNERMEVAGKAACEDVGWQVFRQPQIPCVERDVYT